MNTTPLLLTDAYKISHVFQYPPGTEYVYSNLTPRKSRIAGCDEMVFFGLRYFIKKYLIQEFRRFFDAPKQVVMRDYERVVRHALGGIQSMEHIADLHDLGYLPLEIRALPEGTLVPMRVPCLTIENTHPAFYWLTNWAETLMSSVLWQPCTSATIAYRYRKLLDGYAEKTGMPADFVKWQGHDFSFRGMSSPESAILSGMAHLTSFAGTDTIPAIVEAEHYYDAFLESVRTPVGGSVPATEHSVMCAGSKDGELETIRRLINEVHPTGIVSIVSDTWDLWKVLDEYLPQLKYDILDRSGKVVIRPDSGDPVKIICGDPNSSDPREWLGVVGLLEKHFGHTRTSTGHKLLHEKVGMIYGDSITYERAQAICEGLLAQGYASQCVFGIGSYTYQYNTRDTFGTAIKATNVVINGQPEAIFKCPATDDGTKNSAKGFLKVTREGGKLRLVEDVDEIQVKRGELELVYNDGQTYGSLTGHGNTLQDIRERLHPKF